MAEAEHIYALRTDGQDADNEGIGVLPLPKLHLGELIHSCKTITWSRTFALPMEQEVQNLSPGLSDRHSVFSRECGKATAF